MMLHPGEELEMFSVFAKAIEDRRQLRPVILVAREAPVTPSTPVAPPAVTPVAQADGSGDEPKTAAPEITLADFEAAVRTYMNANGLAATRALLTEFGAVRVSDIPAHRKAEFFARLA